MIRSLEEGNMPDAPDAVRELLEASIPLRRYAVPSDVANLMLFWPAKRAAFYRVRSSVDGGMNA